MARVVVETIFAQPRARTVEGHVLSIEVELHFQVLTSEMPHLPKPGDVIEVNVG